MEVSLGNGQCSHLSRARAVLSTVAYASNVAPVVRTSSIRTTVRALEPLLAPTGRKKRREVEGALEVPAPRSRIQPSLRCGGAHAPEDAAHRHTQVPRQLFSLVEALPVRAATDEVAPARPSQRPSAHETPASTMSADNGRAKRRRPSYLNVWRIARRVPS